MLVAGIMSGTSVDAIDVGLFEINGEAEALTVRTVGFCDVPFPPGVPEQVLMISDATVQTAAISQANYLLGQVFADALLSALQRLGYAAGDLELVGCHGQTIYHQPEPTPLCGMPVCSTLQLGEAALVSQACRCPVVSDFRAADLAVGGQGAPLVPYLDFLLLRHPTLNRVALNIGGIANLTALPAGSGSTEVIAFDTGPGNMVMDQIVQHVTGGAQRYDRDGRMALAGSVDKALLAQLLSDPWYSQSPPKSTGRERYGEDFVRTLLEQGFAPERLMATAAELTVSTIVLGIERFVAPAMAVDEILVSGGGWHNPAVIGSLRSKMTGATVRPTDDLGIGTDAKESMAMAVIAYETYHRRPANLPSATGASRPVILGHLTWP